MRRELWPILPGAWPSTLALVDLARNDLPRSSAPAASVSIISWTSNVIATSCTHVLKVTGALCRASTLFDFPRDVSWASLSGAPKIRAMEIIEELGGRPARLLAARWAIFPTRETWTWPSRSGNMQKGACTFRPGGRGRGFHSEKGI